MLSNCRHMPQPASRRSLVPPHLKYGSPHHECKQLWACKAPRGSDTACHVCIESAPRASTQLLCQCHQLGSRYVCKGAPLPGSFNDTELRAPGYDVFMGVELANAYNWTGCPDHKPNGPVALLHTPQVSPISSPVLPALRSNSCTMLLSLPEIGLRHVSCFLGFLLHHTVASNHWHQCASAPASDVQNCTTLLLYDGGRNAFTGCINKG